MRIQEALLDYFLAPGKYQLRRRQPEVLFDSIPEVLQIAAGRVVGSGERARKVQEAASFFIRAALLYPGADHYSILGLRPRTEPVGLKEHYRLLMRLIHPDFTGDAAGGWPADAAVRVNRAYEVLSSPVLRREYDEQLVAAPQKRPAEAVQHGRGHVPVARPARAAPLRGAHKAAWTFVVLASLLALAMLLVPQDRVALVQKTVVPVAKTTTPLPASEPAPQQSVARQETPAPPPPADTRPARARTGPAQSQAEVAAANTAQREPPAPARAPAPRGNAPPQQPAPQAPVPERDQRLAAAPTAAGAQQPIPAAPRPPPPPVALSMNVPVPASPAAGSNPDAIRVAAIRTAVRPTLVDAQPLLTNLLQLLESGTGEDILRLLDDDARQKASAQALSRRYQQIVGRGGRVRLSHVDFKGEPRDDVLVVTGHMRLHVGESTIGSAGEMLLLRAEFASRGGRVVLTSLSGGVD